MSTTPKSYEVVATVEVGECPNRGCGKPLVLNLVDREKYEKVSCSLCQTPFASVRDDEGNTTWLSNNEAFPSADWGGIA